jgi:signal transduction histidine kinase
MRAEQIRLLYANAPFGFVATTLNIIILSLTQWPVIAPSTVISWGVSMLGLTGLRALLVWQFFRSAPGVPTIKLWGLLFNIGTGLAGFGWGVTGLCLFPADSIPHQVFLAFVLGGMITGAVGLLSAQMPVYLLFVGPTALPIIVRLWMQGDHLLMVMGGMAALFTVVMIFTAWKFHLIILSSLQLRFDNIDLVASVTAEKERVERLNTELTAEISERQRAEDALRLTHEELELRVQERTAELSMALTRLQTEMGERQQLAEQLRQAQKMEAVGRLAGGIAHDFNNLLTVIHGYSQLALSALQPNDALREHIEQIVKAGARASTLTSRLLAFSRRQVLQLQVLNLNDVVTDIGHMLTRIIGEDVDLVVQLLPSLWPIQADPAQLEHVIVNLVVNARDAMPQGGTLTIETANVVENQSYETEGAKRGPYVTLTIRDTGIGMSADVQAHLFEPFFTTKEVGKGTGLGLALVYGVVQQSGGHIRVESMPGQGSTFRIYFPKTREVRQETEAKRLDDKPAGSETILLVEDEAVVRSLVRQILLSQGYSVLEAENGATALRIAQDYQHPIHLVLTDVVMPGMHGRELVEQLLPQRPQLRVLYMSGYTDDRVLQHGVLHSSMNFLQKPFTPDQLVKKLRDILDYTRS